MNNRSFKCFVSMVLTASMVFGCINLPGLPVFSDLAPRILYADGNTVEAETWAGLQEAIDNAETGDTIVLKSNIEPGYTDNALRVSGKEITIDLDIHSINRDLTNPVADGYVISVYSGKLTIKGNGIIRGGRNTGSGGGIYVGANGSLVLEGGTILDNTSGTHGGGIYCDGDSVTLDGTCTISSNTAAASGGGIYVSNGDLILKSGSILENRSGSSGSGVFASGTAGINISGDHGTIDVRENSRTADESFKDNIYLGSGQKISISGTPNAHSRIGINTEDTPEYGAPVEFAAGADSDWSSSFISDGSYGISWDGSDKISLVNNSIAGWTQLQDAITNGGLPEYSHGDIQYVIRLTQNITAGSGDTYLDYDPSYNHPVILDLNGFTIDRGLEQAVNGGYVMKISSGELIITDSTGGGLITGGSNTGAGGGIYVGMDAHLTMNGGTISGNYTSQYGSGVYVDNIASFTQNGGSVTGNKAALGGGVYFAGTYTVSGNAEVTGNKDGQDNPSNILINVCLTISGDLSSDADLGVSPAGNYSVPVTNGFSAVSDTVDIYSVFSSDMQDRCLFLEDTDGEVWLGSKDSHTGGEAVWDWEDDLSGATASVFCEVCGGLIASESTDDISDPCYDADSGTAYVTATVTLAGEDVTGRKVIGTPVFCEETSPVIENGEYIPGTVAHHRINVGNKVCFFEDNDGVPGDLITDVRLSYLTVSDSTITGYTLPIDPSAETDFEIPGTYRGMTDPLTVLGAPDTVFFTGGGTDGRIVMTDHGNITTVNASAFGGINDLELILSSTDPIAVNGIFEDCGNVKIMCYHSSGLEYGDHPDQGFTVDYIDSHTYVADPEKTEWSDDYTSARICLVCSECGAEIKIDPTEITRETNADGTVRITATGTLGDDTYSAVLDNVPTWLITLSTGDEIRVPRRKTGTGEYALDAVFSFGSVDPDIEAPDYSSLAGWKNGNTVYSLDETVTISCDMTYEAVWRTVWHEVQEALESVEPDGSIDITLYSDLTALLGDTYLHIPESVRATIDLNGFTIDRNLPNVQMDGFVFKVDGKLILKNGTVTGGNNTGNGGAVYVSGELTTSEVSLYRNKAQNGAGIYIAPADPDVEGSTAGKVSMHRGSITFNEASKLGGGIFISVGGDLFMTSEIYTARSGKNAGGDGDGAVIVEDNIAGEDGGGIFIERGGHAHLEGNPQIVNNTTGNATGEFNNVVIDPAAAAGGAAEMGGMLSFGALVSTALIGLGITKAMLIKFLAVAIGVIIVAGVVIYIFMDKGRKKGGEDPGQRGQCDHEYLRDTEWDWEEDYNTAHAALICPVCGQVLHDDCTPVISLNEEDKVNTYTATAIDDRERVYTDEKTVDPYVVTLTDEIPSITKTELLPHLKDESVSYTLQVPPEFEQAHPHSTPNGWTDESGRSVSEVVEIDKDRNFNLKWDTYFAIQYTPGADDIDPIEPVDWVCLVEKGKDHDLIGNRYTRSGYDFTGYLVAAEGSVEPPDEYQPGDTLSTVQCDYVVTSQWRSKWDIFNESMGNNDNTELALTEDLNAKAEDVNLTVPSSRTDPLTIDLAGHTINRQLTGNVQYGNAITVSNALTLTNGTIRGAANSGNGGAIVLNPGAMLTMTSMILTGNGCSGNGAGIYAANNSTINISGMLDIDDPIHLTGNAVINVTGTLDPDAEITVTMATPGVFTSGLSGKGSVDNFVSGDSRYTVALNEDGEACLYANVTFDKGDPDAEGVIPSRLVIPGSVIILPHCSYITPYGKEFSHWLVQSGSSLPYEADESTPVTITGNTTITAVWEEITEPEVVYNTVVLSGQIGMSFYMYLPGDISEYQDSYMDFTVNDSTKTVPFSEAEQILIGGDPYYRFICKISSIQMAETITAEFHYGNDEVSTDSGSVKGYIDYILAEPDTVTPEEYDLVVAIGNLGHYCQPVLAEQNGWEYGVDYKTMPVVDPISYAQVTEAAEACSGYSISTDYLADHNYIFYSLFLKSETMIAVYLATYLDGTVTAQIDGNDADVEEANGYYRVRVRNISADRLAGEHVIDFYVDGTKVTSTTVYALSYVDSVLNSTGASYTTEHKLCVTALYRYYLAARNLKDTQNGN